MLDVFLTCDTELWPANPELDFEAAIDRYLRGRTSSGLYGVPYQLDVLDRHGLTATFFVEALHAYAIGSRALDMSIEWIAGRGHAVELHLHPEWMPFTGIADLEGPPVRELNRLSEDTQSRLVELGLASLERAGARSVTAFRAGGFGANRATLRALARNGIGIDSSHDIGWLTKCCRLQTPDLLVQPRRLEGVWEFPITCIQDLPGHFRHAQLAACTYRDLESALEDAERAGHRCVVLLWHSGEMVGVDRFGRVCPRWHVIERFERLAAFLDAQRHRFRTRRFSDATGDELAEVGPVRPLRFRPRLAAFRVAQQLARALG